MRAVIPIRRKADDDPLGDISTKLSDAIKQSQGVKPEGKNPKEPTKEAAPPPEGEAPSMPDLGGPEPPQGDTAKAPEEGSGVPSLQLPSLPTEPSMEAPPEMGAPQEEEQNVEELAENVKKLQQTVQELVDDLKETITTAAPPGQATLSNAQGKEGPIDGDGQSLDFGLEQSTHPFTRPIATRRSPMKNRTRVAFPVRRAEEGVTELPPESLETQYEEASPKVEGEKPFVLSPPKLTTEKEVDHAVEESKEEEGLPELLYPKASDLRAARKARLGLEYSGFAKVSQEGRSALFAAAERKSSDMAALRVARYYKALELACDAQQRGIEEFPLHSLLTARLATYGVPDAELVAADVLEGSFMESFRAAHTAALKYMRMDDQSFLNVQATIARTPTLNSRGAFLSDKARIAHTVRKEASEGSLPLQASASPQSGMESLRQTLRKGTPRPHSLSR